MYTQILDDIKEEQNSASINLANNDLSTLDNECLTTVFQALAQCQNLQSINLSNNELGRLDNKRLATVFQALARCQNLQSLNLSNNELGRLDNKRLAAVFQVLAQCQKLQSINLSWSTNLFDLVECKLSKTMLDFMAQCKNLTQVKVEEDLSLIFFKHKIKEICKEHHNARITAILSAAFSLRVHDLPNEINLQILTFAFPVVKKETISKILHKVGSSLDMRH